MSEGLIVSALVVAVLLGVGSAAFLVMRSPAFWGDVGKELFSKAWPQIWAVLSKRMDPEAEARWRECERRGGRWDHRRKRCDR
jgi:hypothetical protein